MDKKHYSGYWILPMYIGAGFWILALLALAGCAEPVRPPMIITEPKPPPAIAITPVEHRIVGKSVQNRLIMCTVLGQGTDTTLILATIHGNEPAGTPLVHRLSEELQKNTHLLQGRKVVLMPTANPDGAARYSRYNANGVDLNRNFASANRSNSERHGYAALSEPEAGAIASVIRQYSPDRIVSIHQRTQNASACIDYDGPGQRLADLMANHCGSPIHRFGAQPGSLGSYAGLTLGIPIITLELPFNAQSLSADSLWQQYRSALMAAVTYSNMAK
jgi:protein MpaA